MIKTKQIGCFIIILLIKNLNIGRKKYSYEKNYMFIILIVKVLILNFKRYKYWIK